MKKSQLGSYIEVDLGAIAHNLAVLKEWVQPTPVMAVVKSNAYGHGMLPVAQALQTAGVQWFGVVSADEGLALRRSGIKGRIVILGWVPPERFKELAAGQLEVALFSPKQWERAVEETTPSPPLRVHLKIETGLGRLGFLPEELRAIKPNPNIEVAGIYSHLASVEETNLPYAQRQITIFQAVLEDVPAKNITRHLASTASAVLLPESRLDLVRLGIGLYGLWPSREVRLLVRQKFGTAPVLTPTLRWYAQVVHLGTVEKGGYVGYGCGWQARRRTRVAVIPLGYAEGLPRGYATGGHVIVRGELAPMIGRICMNMTMLDVTDVRGVSVGDTVTLLGANPRTGSGQAHRGVSADEMAQALGTINYEVVTRIPRETPRVFVEQ